MSIKSVMKAVMSKCGMKSAKPVYILKLNGVIQPQTNKSSTMSLAFLETEVSKALKAKPHALCIVINSPGGSPVQSEAIATRIISLTKKHKVPVFTFIEDVGASGGYWLACIGQEIYASKNSIVGSIGVVYRGFGMKKALEKLGIERRVYTSGKQKSMLDPFQDAKEEDVELIKEIQQEIHDNFINFVKERRGNKLRLSSVSDNIKPGLLEANLSNNPSESGSGNNIEAQSTPITQEQKAEASLGKGAQHVNNDNIFTGRIWTGKQALSLGLIDGISDVYSFIENTYPKAEIKYIEAKESFIKKIFSNKAPSISQEIANFLQGKFRV